MNSTRFLLEKKYLLQHLLKVSAQAHSVCDLLHLLPLGRLGLQPRVLHRESSQHQHRQLHGLGGKVFSWAATSSIPDNSSV